MAESSERVVTPRRRPTRSDEAFPGARGDAVVSHEGVRVPHQSCGSLPREDA
jgi:hypothetical protein